MKERFSNNTDYRQFCHYAFANKLNGGKLVERLDECREKNGAEREAILRETEIGTLYIIVNVISKLKLDEDIEDAVQVGYLSLRKGLRRYDSSRGSGSEYHIAGFLQRCVRNGIVEEKRLMKKWKKRRVLKNNDLDREKSVECVRNVYSMNEYLNRQRAPDFVSPLDECIEKENVQKENYLWQIMKEKIMAGLQKLPENERRVLEGFFLENKSGREIADELQIALGTVRWRKKQGLDYLVELTGLPA